MRALISTIEAIVFLTGLDIHDRCDAGAVFYQLSYEATQLGAGQFVGLTCSRERADTVHLVRGPLLPLVSV